MPETSDISRRLHEIQKRMGEAAVRSGRKLEDITLLPVTKTLPAETVQKAYDAGLREFGENRVQEAVEKIGLLPPDIRWHLIGQLQTNKINKTLGKFTLIHSIDSAKLAEALSMRVLGGAQDVLLEVNSSGEASKSGTDPNGALLTAEGMSKLPGIRLRGLMTVGPLTEDAQKQRESFKKLKGLFDEIGRKDWAGSSFSILSMGMSGDYETAIEEGSSLVRIGTALFGARG